MENDNKKKSTRRVTEQKDRTFYAYAALWGIPGSILLVEAYRLANVQGLRDSFAQGPAGYITGLGLFLMALCVWELIPGFWRAQREEGVKESSKTRIPPKIYLAVAFMVFFLALLPVLGFILATACFLIGCLRLLGCTARVIVITVIIYCGTLYWALPHLGLSVPRGMFGI